MKKNIVFLLAICCQCISFLGCNNATDTDKDTDPAPIPKIEEVTLQKLDTSSCSFTAQQLVSLVGVYRDKLDSVLLPCFEVSGGAYVRNYAVKDKHYLDEFLSYPSNKEIDLGTTNVELKARYMDRLLEYGFNKTDDPFTYKYQDYTVVTSDNQTNAPYQNTTIYWIKISKSK